MFTYPEATASSEGPAETGPPPYYHRSDCNVCRQQDGLKTGSEPLTPPAHAATSSRVSTCSSSTSAEVVQCRNGHRRGPGGICWISVK